MLLRDRAASSAYLFAIAAILAGTCHGCSPQSPTWEMCRAGPSLPAQHVPVFSATAPPQCVSSARVRSSRSPPCTVFAMCFSVSGLS